MPVVKSLRTMTVTVRDGDAVTVTTQPHAVYEFTPDSGV